MTEHNVTLPDLPRGVIPAAATPLDAQQRPHGPALTRHCRWLLAVGCDAVLVLGTTGEANSFSVPQRLRLLEHLGDAGLGPRLLVGSGCCAVPDTVRLTRQALELGAAGVLMLPPFYYKSVTDDGLFASYAEVIQQVADPRLRLYLYQIPQLTGVQLSLPLVQRLLEAYPRTVVGLKDSSGDWPAMAATLAALPGFALFAGSEEYLLDDLRAGGPGCISATLNVLAPQAVELFARWRSSAAQGLQRRLSGLRRLVCSQPMIPALKALLARRTGRSDWERLRPPLRPLPPAAGDQLAADLEAMLALPRDARDG